MAVIIIARVGIIFILELKKGSKDVSLSLSTL